MAAGRPIAVALVDDYDVVLMGVANMFDRPGRLRNISAANRTQADHRRFVEHFQR